MANPNVERIIEEVAQKHLGVTTLRTQGGDGKDFHDIAVWRLKAALEAAFEAGAATEAVAWQLASSRQR